MVDASGMAVRLHAEKAVSEEEEQEWQVRMESVGRKSGRLERTAAWNGRETVEKTWKSAASQGHPRGEPEERKRRRTWEGEGG